MRNGRRDGHGLPADTVALGGGVGLGGLASEPPIPADAAGQALEFGGRVQMHAPDQFGRKGVLDMALDLKRLPARSSLRDDETPADIERQSEASIAEPCDRDLRLDHCRLADVADDRTDFVPVMRL
jgi:hypothetical protein